jgi:hypothetical protein
MIADRHGADVCQHDRRLQVRAPWCPARQLANLIWLPLANKLHGKLLDEETDRTLIIDGILMIRDPRSPALVREMLLAHRREKHCQEEAEPLPA